MDCKSCRRPIKNETDTKQKELSPTNSDNSCLNKMADGRAFTDYRYLRRRFGPQAPPPCE